MLILIKVVAIIIVAWIVLIISKKLVHRLIKTVIKKTYKIKQSTAQKKRTQTLEGVFYSTIKIIVLALALLMVLAEFGVNIGPVLAAMGVFGIAFGFGAQYLIRDLISGLFIILEDQYREGDVISVAGVSGVVEGLNLRKTILRDLDGGEHHVPNGEIKITSNQTKLLSKINLNIGVAYDSNLKDVTEVLDEVGLKMSQINKWKEVITEAPKVLGVDDFADSAIILKIVGQTKPGEQWAVTRELRRRIKIAFDKKGIEIPFPHRVVIQK